MLRDPHEAGRFAHDHQLQLGREAANARLAAEIPKRRGPHGPRGIPVFAGVSHLMLAVGLWLRARGERQPSADAIPAGGWHTMPLMLLRIGDGVDGTTTSVGVRWPVYTLSQRAIERSSGYVILPASWLPADGAETRAEARA